MFTTYHIIVILARAWCWWYPAVTRHAMRRPGGDGVGWYGTIPRCCHGTVCFTGVLVNNAEEWATYHCHRRSTFNCILTNNPCKVIALSCYPQINYDLILRPSCESHDAQAWSISTVTSSAYKPLLTPLRSSSTSTSC